jgi:phosphatidate cytidylyltransferase
MKRILTALVLIPVVVWLVLWAPAWALTLALSLVGLLAFHEYDRIAKLIVGQAFSAPDARLGQAILSPANRLITNRPALFVIGFIYIFIPLGLAVPLRAWNPTGNWLMFALLLSWAGDTAALYIGKAFGRHKLAPVISPKKTWEGAFGSIAGALIAGGIYAHYLIPDTRLAIILPLAIAGNIAGQLGDLAESALKRRAGIKDSGSSLPGHGGWLDRIDSILFTVPVIYALVRLVRNA